MSDMRGATLGMKKQDHRLGKPANDGGGIPVSHEVVVKAFAHAVRVGDDGRKILVLTKMNGEQEQFHFTPENADLIGRAMLNEAANKQSGIDVPVHNTKRML